MGLNWVIAGGGTGGHVTLALALGEEIARRGEDLLFIGSDAGQEVQLIPQAGHTLVALPSRQVMGRGPLGRALGAAGILRAYWQAMQELSRFSADLVVSVGGYAALPVALAAVTTGRPLALVEPNAMPGRSNRLTARFATRVFTGFEGAARHLDSRKGGAGAIRCTGVPLRHRQVEEFRELPVRQAPKAPFHLLVFGGSQGAKQINEAFVEAAPLLDALPLKVFHQTGVADRERVAEAYERAGIQAEVVDFEPNMPARYRWADLAVSRAGALSVAELTLAGLPALLVPYPWAADDHQAANATELESAGAARRLQADPNHRLRGEVAAAAISELFNEPEALVAMSEASGKLARPQAAHQIVEECAEMVR